MAGLRLYLCLALLEASVVIAKPALGGGLSSMMNRAKEDMSSAVFGFQYAKQDRAQSEVRNIQRYKVRVHIGCVDFGKEK